MPSGEKVPLRLRSMVGLIPLFAVGVVEQEEIDRLPELWRRIELFREHRPELVKLVSRWNEGGREGTPAVFARARLPHDEAPAAHARRERVPLRPTACERCRASYLDRPLRFRVRRDALPRELEPGESDSALFGGNSNWRGPVWMPVNYLLIENLRRFYQFYGDGLTIECPTGSGRHDDVSTRLPTNCAGASSGLFLRGADGRRPVFGNYEKFQVDPHFKDYILFHEYFHGDNGRGCGASHQTGWSGARRQPDRSAGRTSRL